MLFSDDDDFGIERVTRVFAVESGRVNNGDGKVGEVFIHFRSGFNRWRNDDSNSCRSFAVFLLAISRMRAASVVALSRTFDSPVPLHAWHLRKYGPDWISSSPSSPHALQNLLIFGVG
jgi:hypothetical protein